MQQIRQKIDASDAQDPWLQHTDEDKETQLATKEIISDEIEKHQGKKKTVKKTSSAKNAKVSENTTEAELKSAYVKKNKAVK